MNLETNAIAEFPDARLGAHAKQSYFLGLAFSGDGKHLYASMGSLTRPDRKIGWGYGEWDRGVFLRGREGGAGAIH